MRSDRPAERHRYGTPWGVRSDRPAERHRYGTPWGLRLSIATVALILAAAGCRSAHLSDDFGVLTRRAFDAQATRRTSEAPGPRDAKDVKQIMERHHSADVAGAPPPQGPGLPPQLPLEAR